MPRQGFVVGYLDGYRAVEQALVGDVVDQLLAAASLGRRHSGIKERTMGQTRSRIDVLDIPPHTDGRSPSLSIKA
jgi:hypothetical protein